MTKIILNKSERDYETLLNCLSEIWTERLSEWDKSTEIILLKSTIKHQKFIQQFWSALALNTEESLILSTALIPHLRVGFFEQIISGLFPKGGDLPILGGIKGVQHRGFLPTGETILFLLAGHHVDKRLQAQVYFSEEHLFYQKGILWLSPVKEEEPKCSGQIIVDREWMEKELFGKESAPRFGLDFPAKKITTKMNWPDVVLHPFVKQQIDEIKAWINYSERLFQDENLGRKIYPGYRVLFYGPSGTGKTLTASLLGKEVGRDVYKIDLSQVVSKYIGETEKNLESIFKKAESKNWILFFDEADSLFGKRTQVQSSNDRYANQEVSYLLQRIEDYPGVLILASNLKNNLDDAFVRRFQNIIHFPMPDAEERKALWQKGLPSSLKIHPDIDLDFISRNYVLSGANVINAIQFAALKCFSNQKKELTQADLLAGIQNEYQKEGKAYTKH